MKIKKLEECGEILIILSVLLLLLVQILSTSVEEKITSANYKQVSYSDWYGAKSIKQILKESEKNYVNALLNTAIVEDNKTIIKENLKEINKAILKYEAEKTEILIGSKNVPEEYWSQDIDGEMGQIVGLREWSEISNKLSKSLARMKIGILFIQIAIIFSIVFLLIQDNLKRKRTFAVFVIISSAIGTLISSYAFSLSL